MSKENDNNNNNEKGWVPIVGLEAAAAAQSPPEVWHISSSAPAEIKDAHGAARGPSSAGFGKPALEPFTYKVNEIFYSIQGEGCLAGTPMLFVRLSNCNLRCRADGPAGFDCDTEFVSGRVLSMAQLIGEMHTVAHAPGADALGRWCLLTGGEPGLQIDTPLLTELHRFGWRIAVETNGTIALPCDEAGNPIDWICVSPKSAEHTLRQRRANEVKYVRRARMGVPETVVEADNYVLSPGFQADWSVQREDLDWCIRLCKENPKWRLSVQMHKLWNVR